MADASGDGSFGASLASLGVLVWEVGYFIRQEGNSHGTAPRSSTLPDADITVTVQFTAMDGASRFSDKSFIFTLFIRYLQPVSSECQGKWLINILHSSSINMQIKRKE